jgi:peptidoglycan hydrolase-like protein with peptidoglycan-binding domain
MSLIRSFQRQHQGNGWGDIGYNFLIDAWGNIYEGRGLNMVGAHAGGQNTPNIGVCFIGDGRTGEMPDAAKQALRTMYAWANLQTGKTLTRLVHSDLNRTTCPGLFIRDWVKNGGLTEGVAEPVVAAPAPALVSAPAPVRYPVADVQRLLGQWGFPTAIDGINGPNTRAQVSAFQSARRIAVDGIVGPVTWAQLNTARPTVAMPMIRPGSTGDAVRELQRRLGGIAVDGIFGPNTERAVRAFQSSQRLAVDGIVGPNTWSRLR